jgi:hypothetical protein
MSAFMQVPQVPPPPKLLYGTRLAKPGHVYDGGHKLGDLLACPLSSVHDHGIVPSSCQPGSRSLQYLMGSGSANPLDAVSRLPPPLATVMPSAPEVRRPRPSGQVKVAARQPVTERSGSARRSRRVRPVERAI